MFEIRRTPELTRILTLPRRRADDPKWEGFARELTEALRTPSGTMTLFPVQALALHDIAIYGGGFCPMPVGGGKTLVTLLAPYVLDSERTALLLPANLIEKTKREIAKLSKHWRIPKTIRIFSYELLGRSQAATELEAYAPDLIVADESHKLKNKRAAVTRRVNRLVKARPDIRMIELSGTIMRKTLLDFAPGLRRCLKANAPVPASDSECEEWALALDPGVPREARFGPGALLMLADDEDQTDSLVAARRGFQKRLIETPGVVATSGDGEKIGASIYIHVQTYPMRSVEAAFRRLRGAWELPDDWRLNEPMDVWRHAREFALGFYYAWDPRPPQEWLEARRDWFAFVREILSRSRTLDSPEQVEIACDEGRFDNALLEAWRAIEPIYTRNQVAVWLDESALEFCTEWMRKPGIVWTEHTHFAERLSKVAGVQYYGAEGLAADGTYIEDDPGGPIVASIDANREGKNLQHKWSRNLVTSVPTGADEWEQLIGRTHRYGQQADEVTFDVMWGCAEHINAWRGALATTEAVRDTVGGSMPKLLIADIDAPSEEQIARLVGNRWRKP